MADASSETATRQKLTADQVVDGFLRGIQDPDQAHNQQRELYYSLKKKYPDNITRKQLADEIGKDPEFSKRFEITDPAPPESRSGQADDLSVMGTLKTMGGQFLHPFTSVVGHPVSEYLESQQPKLHDPVSRFTGQMVTEAARFGEDTISPFGIATLGLGTVPKSAVAGSKVLAGLGNTIRGGFSLTQGSHAIRAAYDLWHDPTPENLAKAISAGSLAATGAAASYGFRKAPGSGEVAPAEAPPTARPRATGSIFGLDEEWSPPPARGEAAPPRSAPVPSGDYKSWRDQHFTKTPEGHWRGTIDGFTADFTDERMHAEYDRMARKQIAPPAKQQGELPPISAGNKVADSSTGRMAYQSPPAARGETPQIKLIGGPPKPKGLIESGPSGYVPDPRAQSRISAVEANKIAQQFKVSPSKLVELSGLPNETLVSATNALSDARRVLLNDPSDMVTQPSGAQRNKQELLDQYEALIGALQQMQLYRQQPPPTR